MNSAYQAGLLVAALLTASFTLAQDSHNSSPATGGSHVSIGSSSGTHGGTFGPGGRTSSPAATSSGNHGQTPTTHPRLPNNHSHYYGYGYGYGYSPYGASYELPYDSEYDQLPGRGTFDQQQQQEQPDDRVGPTVFEHNGRAASPSAGSRRAVSNQPPPAETAPEPASTPQEIVLVFRDGHQQEVENYAIAGDSVIVLGEKTEKISLRDLDTEATKKANQERGVDFKMPHAS